MVGVVAADLVGRYPVALGRGDYHDLRAVPPDYPHQIAPQFQRRLDATVRIVEELDAAQSQDAGCLALLRLAQLADAPAGLRAHVRGVVRPTAAPLGHDDEPDRPALLDPAGDRPAAPDLHVVRMRDDHECTFLVGHRAVSFRCPIALRQRAALFRHRSL